MFFYQMQQGLHCLSLIQQATLTGHQMDGSKLLNKYDMEILSIMAQYCYGHVVSQLTYSPTSTAGISADMHR